MENNPLQECLEKRIQLFGRESFINLIDSNFLDNGFILPPEIIQQGMADWLTQRSYHPHPKGDLRARQAIANFYQVGGPVSQISPDNAK